MDIVKNKGAKRKGKKLETDGLVNGSTEVKKKKKKDNKRTEVGGNSSSCLDILDISDASSHLPKKNLVSEKSSCRLGHDATSFESFAEAYEKSNQQVKKKKRKLATAQVSRELPGSTGRESGPPEASMSAPSPNRGSLTPSKKKRAFPPLSFSGDGKVLASKFDNQKTDPVQVTVTNVTEKMSNKKKQTRLRRLAFVGDGTTILKDVEDEVNNEPSGGNRSFTTPEQIGDKKTSKLNRKRDEMPMETSDMPVKKKKKKKRKHRDEKNEDAEQLVLEHRKEKKKKKNAEDKITSGGSVEVVDNSVEEGVKRKKKKKKKSKEKSEEQIGQKRKSKEKSEEQIGQSQTESEPSTDRPQDDMLRYMFLQESEELSQESQEDKSVPIEKNKKKKKKKKKNKELSEPDLDSKEILDPDPENVKEGAKNKKKKKKKKHQDSESEVTVDNDLAGLSEDTTKKKKKKKKHREPVNEVDDDADDLESSKKGSRKKKKRQKDAISNRTVDNGLGDVAKVSKGDKKKKKKQRDPENEVTQSTEGVSSVKTEICEKPGVSMAETTGILTGSVMNDGDSAPTKTKKKKKRRKSREGTSAVNDNDDKEDQPDMGDIVMFDTSADEPRIIGTIAMCFSPSNESGSHKKKKKKDDKKVEEIADLHDSMDEFVENKKNKKDQKRKRKRSIVSEDDVLNEETKELVNNGVAPSDDDGSVSAIKNEVISPPEKKKRKSSDAMPDIDVFLPENSLRGLTQKSDLDMEGRKSRSPESRKSRSPEVQRPKSPRVHLSDASDGLVTRSNVVRYVDGEVIRVFTPKKVRRGIRRTSFSENKVDSDTCGASTDVNTMSPREESLSITPNKTSHSQDELQVRNLRSRSSKSPGSQPSQSSRNRDSTGSSNYGTPVGILTEQNSAAKEHLKNSCSPKKKSPEKSPRVRFEEPPQVVSPEYGQGSDSSDYTTPPETKNISPEKHSQANNLCRQSSEDEADNRPSTSGLGYESPVNDDGSEAGDSGDDLIPPSPVNKSTPRRRSLDPIVTGVRNGEENSSSNSSEKKGFPRSRRKCITTAKDEDLDAITSGSWMLPKPLNNPTGMSKRDLAALERIHAGESQHLGYDWRKEYTDNGFTPNMGKFEPLEDRQLMYNFEKYFQENPAARQWAKKLFSDYRNAEKRKFLLATKFDLKMTHGILRPKKAILRRLRYLIRRADSGDYSDQQKKKVVQLREKGHNWDFISAAVGSSKELTRLLYEVEADAKIHENYKKGSWEDDEVEDLMEAIMEVTGHTFESMKGCTTGIDWEVVSRNVKTRSVKQCRRRWVQIMGAVPYRVYVSPEQRIEFLELLVEMYGKGSNWCNFEHVAKKVSWETSGANLQRNFTNWRRKIIPDYADRTNAQVVVMLRDILVPKLQAGMERYLRKNSEQGSHVFGC